MQSIQARFEQARFRRAHAVSIWIPHVSRNEWINWDGDTSIVQRPLGSIYFDRDTAMKSVEKVRTPGSVYSIQETVGIALIAKADAVLIVEWHSKLPFRSLLPYFEGITKNPTLANLASRIPKDRSWKTFPFLGTANNLTEETRNKGFMLSKAKAGGRLNGLAWATKSYDLDTTAARDLIKYLNHLPARDTEAVVGPVAGGQPITPPLNELAFHQSEPRHSIAEPPSTTKEQLVSARRGQELFRQRLELLEPRCRFTGVQDKAHLVASHIKPWADCLEDERLDGNNGLLLSPHVDHLFDNGYISFTNKGDIMYAAELSRDVLKAWGLNFISSIGPFREEQLSYLAYHRKHVYRGIK